MKKVFLFATISLVFVSCGNSRKDAERQRNIEMLNSYIEQQVESGIGQRYNNLDEFRQAMETQQRMNQESGSYQKVQCSSCGGYGQYYNNQGKLMTCPTCAGTGYVHRYN